MAKANSNGAKRLTLTTSDNESTKLIRVPKNIVTDLYTLAAEVDVLECLSREKLLSQMDSEDSVYSMLADVYDRVRALKLLICEQI